MKLLALILALCSLACQASPLDNWARNWEQGKAFAEYSDYQDLYKTTKDRKFEIKKQLQEGDVIIASYEVSLVNIESEQAGLEKGVAAFYLQDNKIYTVEFALVDKDIDLATTGQIADIATTAAGLGAGLAEANPLGLAILPIKAVLMTQTDKFNLENCIQLKRGAAMFGWGAAAWNIGMIIASPAVGLVGAVIAIANTHDRASALRSCILEKLK